MAPVYYVYMHQKTIWQMEFTSRIIQTMKPSLIFILCIFSMCLPFPLSAKTEQELVVYGTLGTDIQVMTEVANAILAGEGKAIPDKNGARILILTSPEKHAALKQAFEQNTANIQNVQLTVQIQTQKNEDQNAASVSGAITVTPDGTSVQVRPSFQYQSTETSENTQQLLVTTSGKEATLRIGEVIPYLEWTIDTARFHPAIHVGTRWQEVGAFLKFKPVIQQDGQTIHLQVTPEIRGKNPNGEPLAYSLTSIQTELVAQNGQTIQIGNWSEANQLYQSFLIGRSKTDQNKNVTINITPRIL